jgi:hypothetical protein
MIVLHAAEAPHDVPGIGLRRGEPIFHLLSDQPRPHGTVELLLFARALGGHDSWLQAPGTYREHFDLFREWAERALELGAAPATNAQVAAILAAKRAAMAGMPRAVPTITSRQRAAADEIVRRGDAAAWRNMHTVLAPARIVAAAGLLSGTALDLRRVVVASAGRRIALARATVSMLARVGVPVQHWMTHTPGEISTIDAIALAGPEHLSLFAQADLIVDLLAPIDDDSSADDIGSTIEAIGRSGAPVLSIDLPSGLDPNEGGPHMPAVRARATLALGIPLRGLALAAARPLTGDLWLGDVGFPPRALKAVGASVGSPLFAASLVRLERAPLAGDLLPSEVDLLYLKGS